MQSMSATIEALQQENFNLKTAAKQSSVDSVCQSPRFFLSLVIDQPPLTIPFQGLNQDLDKENASLKEELQALRLRFESSRKAHEKENADKQKRVRSRCQLSTLRCFCIVVNRNILLLSPDRGLAR